MNEQPTAPVLPIAVASEYAGLVPVDQLQEHPDNPRRGDEEALAHSLRDHGFLGGIIVQRSTGYILAGNHRYRVARAQGMTEIPVFYTDVDDEKATEILVVDNRISDLATTDIDQLVRNLMSLPDPTRAGYEPEEVQALVDRLSVTDEHIADPDPTDFWPILNLRLPPEVHALYSQLTEGYENEHQRFHELLLVAQENLADDQDD